MNVCDFINNFANVLGSDVQKLLKFQNWILYSDCSLNSHLYSDCGHLNVGHNFDSMSYF